MLLKPLPILAVATLVAASPNFAATVTFDNGASDVALFNQVVNTGSAGQYSANAASGTSGGAGMDKAGTTGGTIQDSTAVYTTALDFANAAVGTTFTISGFVKASDYTTFNYSTYQIGFTQDSGQAFLNSAGYNWATFRLANGSLQTQSRTDPSAAVTTTLQSGTGSTMNTGDWYNYTFTLTKSSTVGTFTYTGSLQNWGSTGATLISTLGSYSGTITNSTLYNDTSVYAGIRMTNGGTVDNVAIVTAVPEPGTYGLISAGAITGTAFVRRRKKNRSHLSA